jgi:heavy metal sensor kinase
MKLNSFRLKIALLSGLVTGLLLVGFGYGLWRISYRLNLDHLDREIRNLGQANLDRVQGGEHWIRLEQALKFVAGNRESADFILWVKNYDKVVFQSTEWPGELDPESFHISDKYAGPDAPKTGQPLPAPPRRGEQISPQNPALPLKQAEFLTRAAAGKTWRVGVMGNPYVTLVLAADMGEFDARMAELRNTYLLALLAVLVLLAASAWLIAGRALRPVGALTQIAERVTARGLDQRIPAVTYEAEFNRLITVFNEMMARLEKSFQQATRFSADASHELKTPLARLQAELEQALVDTPDDSPHQPVFTSLLEEVCRLKAIVQKLLLLSLADAGQLKLQREPVNLTNLVEAVVEDCRAQAPQLTVDSDLAPDISVDGDSDLLEQALQNLAVNAVKYNRPQGRIHFELSRESDRIFIRVTNTGAGVAPAEREKIFERFYRADSSRSQQVPGVGLGLSLSREIIRIHGGDLKLEENLEDLTSFVIELSIP